MPYAATGHGMAISKAAVAHDRDLFAALRVPLDAVLESGPRTVTRAGRTESKTYRGAGAETSARRKTMFMQHIEKTLNRRGADARRPCVLERGREGMASVKKKQVLAWAALTALCAMWSGPVQAQAGISVETGTQQGLLGSDKPTGYAIACPAGRVASGTLHVDIRMDILATETDYNARGMTGEAGLYCSRVSSDGTNVTVQQTTPNGSPQAPGPLYAQRDPATTQSAYCPVGEVVHQFGGWDRVSQPPYPWVSAVRMVCRPLILNANDWVRVNTAAAGSYRDAGNLETDIAPHVSRGPFCNGSATTIVSGVHAEYGGAGYDGLSVNCGGLLQARFSAVITFTDFAWNKTLGGGGWLVNLQRGGTTLSDGGNNNGAGRTPHASAAANINEFQANREIYVVPNSGYTAQVSQRPASVAADTHDLTGTCVTGITLGNEADSACTLNVRGLPDIGVGITTTPLTYNSHGETQNFTVTGTNYGPGAVGASDGFTLQTTLPAGWAAAAVPGCTVACQVVTCAITTAMAASSSPGAAGGSRSFTFPVTVNAPTAPGSFTANLALGRSATNDDYDTANDTASGTLILLQPGRLTINKALPNGRAAAADQFTLSIVGPGAPAAVTTTGSGSTATGTITHAAATPGSVYTLSEAAAAGTNLANYSASYSCTNTRPGGQTLSGNGASFNVTPVSGDNFTCTFSNARWPQLTLIKSVTNNNGGNQLATAWTLSAAGPTPLSGTTGSASVTNVPVGTGTYTLSESATPTGYTASLYSCVKNGGAAVASNNIALAMGDVATCTINNNDRPATLTLVKTVTNDNGGTQLATAWTLSAAGPTNISGTTGAAAVTNATVNPGSYTLSESATPTGYTASTYSCIKNGGAAVVSNSIALVAGDVASCTINNNDSNQTDVEIEKTATPNPVRAGAQVQFTLVVNNRGPAAAHGAILRDPVTAGLDCTAASLPATSCSATGGATCPAPLTASGLQAGVAIPALPNGGAVTIVLTCNVTASGVP
jgi:uncharacterized repeat protein (TIGR01451 family)